MPRAVTLLPTAAYVALAVADSVAAGRPGSPAARRLRCVLKPALMPALAVAFRGDPRRRGTAAPSLLRTGTATAQAFSWGGDVALLGTGRRSFLAGVGSFFGAHVAYLAAFLSVRGEPRDYDAAGLGLALGMGLSAAPVMGLAAGRRDPALRAPVAAYVALLATMFASSRMLDPALPPNARRSLRAGTALFLVSDLVLAVHEFLLTEPPPVLQSVVMATYTAGQGLIARGVAGAS